MLTPEQQEFLLENKVIFEKLVPLQKKILEDKQKKIYLNKDGHQVNLNKKEQKEREKKKVEIKKVLERMTLGDINRFEALILGLDE
jgi:hypothetical protein